MRGIDQRCGRRDGLRKTGLVEHKRRLRKSALQAAQQFRMIIADEQSGDAARALGDNDGPESGLAVAKAQGFRPGGIKRLRCHSGPPSVSPQ